VAFKNKMGQLVVVNPDSPMHNKAYAANVYARDRWMLEMAEARELYYNYFNKPKGQRNAWLSACLARCDKLYGEGGGERVRKYMGVVRDEIQKVAQDSE
jgi:hypothetical protein